MTLEQLRGKAARSVVAATVTTLMLVVSPAHSQTSPAASPAEIDSFLSNLDDHGTAAAPAPTRVEAGVRATDDTSTSSAAAPAKDADSRPLMSPEDDSSPLRTLLLMLGGIGICALATVGLTLTFFALRKDIQRKKRSRRRRFGPFDPPGAIQAANR